MAYEVNADKHKQTDTDTHGQNAQHEASDGMTLH